MDLAEAYQKTNVPIPRRVAAWAFLQVGTPYVGGALGEESGRDTDPLIRYDVTDCTILNLVSVSLAHAAELGPRKAMLRAGYAPPHKATYESRLHFTTDRLDRSPYFRDITSRFPGAKAKTVILNRRRDGSRWIPIKWEKKRVVRYVPSGRAKTLKNIPEVVGVAFVKEKMLDDGLDVMHEGLLYRGTTVVHASLKEKKVIKEPFSEIVSRYDGVVFFEYR